LCELLFGATCSGTDSHIIEGSFPWISPLPTVLGHESVGRVVKVGRKVRNFRLGDVISRVGTPASPAAGLSVTWGGFAEFGIAKDHWAMAADGLPASEWSGARWNQVLPAGLDPRVGPMFTTWRETLSFLTRCGFQAGHSLLVFGSGGNGLSYARHGHNLGASYVAMAGSPRLESAAKAKAGVSLFFDYRRSDLTDAIRAARPDGFDFIIDAVGQQGVAERALPCLRSAGHYAMYGIDEFGKVRIDPTAARGTFTFHGPGDYDEAETHQRVCDFVLQGRLETGLWYEATNPFPLAAINEAFAAVKRRETVKALVRLRD
jgi:threonine dehydrogenase-like Zn-dependent dehydrogenase